MTKFTVEIVSNENSPWSTVIVRKGRFLQFTATHRDVSAAFLAFFASTSTEFVCVFHRDCLRDITGRFALGIQPTVCTAYDVGTMQTTSFLLHGINPRHILPGKDGVYIFGEQIGLGFQSGEPLITLGDGTNLSAGGHYLPVVDAWWMSSPLSLKSIYSPVPTQQFDRPHVLDARLIGEFKTSKSWFAVALTNDGSLRIAKTGLVIGHQALRWIWLPQKLNFDFTEDMNFVVTISEHTSIDRHVLFVFCSTLRQTFVLRTPSLDSPWDGKTNFEHLFTVPTSCPGFVMDLFPAPCVQPIALVRGRTLYLYCPFTLSNDPADGQDGVVSVLLPSIQSDESVNDVLFVEKGSLTVSIVETDTTYTVSLPTLHVDSIPIVTYVVHTLLFSPGVAPTRAYEALHWMVRHAWQNVGNPVSVAGCDVSWHSLALFLRLSFIRSFASRDDVEGLIQLLQNGARETNDKIDKQDDWLLDSCKFSYESLRPRSETLTSAGDDTTLLGALQKLTNRLPTAQQDESSLDTATRYLESEPWDCSECANVVLSLHALCESFKVQQPFWPLLKPMGELLMDLFSVARLQIFSRYHATALCMSESESPMANYFSQTESLANILVEVPSRSSSSATVFDRSSQWFLNNQPFDITQTLLDLVEGGKAAKEVSWPVLSIPNDHPLFLANEVVAIYATTFRQTETQPWWYVIIQAMHKRGLTIDSVRTLLPAGVALPFLRAIHIAKEHVDETWSLDLVKLVGRIDTVMNVNSTLSSSHHHSSHTSDEVLRLSKERAVAKLYHASLTDDDSVCMDPSFSKSWSDNRLDTVQSLLNTTTHIHLPGRENETGDLHALLKTLTIRAMTLCIGRGMLTMATQNYRSKDTIPIPPLCLDGRTSDGITVAADPTFLGSESVIWPNFHNGCAAGLRFLPLITVNASSEENDQSAPNGGVPPNPPTVSRHWVVHQMRAAQLAPSKAGLLLSSGLLGHLRVLQVPDIFSLLTSSAQLSSPRDPTRIAVILGLATSFRGTNHEMVFRCLSMHLHSLSSGMEDLDVSLDVQTCTLVSIGLLCERSNKRFLTDMLLNEMSRLPSDEYCKHREGYALAAGIGAGLIGLGSGRKGGFGYLDNRLVALMNGDRRDAHEHQPESLTEKFPETGLNHGGHFLTKSLMHRAATHQDSDCNRVAEGPCFNVHVSGPAAIVALGFRYLQTNDLLMMNQITPINTLPRLQALLPDHCMLRYCLSSLVMWDSIAPSHDWLLSRLPSTLLELAKSTLSGGAQSEGQSRPPVDLDPPQVDYLMMNLGHAIGGLCLALGLRYAGTMNADVRAVILAELRGFATGFIGRTGVKMTALQKTTSVFDACISSCSVALAMVMAGTGDSATLKLLRKLAKRSNASYGFHLSISMSMGLLFLGGGRYSLSTDQSSVAALFIAFYPVWPRDATDNSHHLQALRHLYVLAVEGRYFETVDAVTGQPVSVNVRLFLQQTRIVPDTRSPVASLLFTPMPKGTEEQVLDNMTPCLLPNISTIESLEVRSSSHYRLKIRGSQLQLKDPKAFVTCRVLSNTDGGVDETSIVHPEQYWRKMLQAITSTTDSSSAESLVSLFNMQLLLTFSQRYSTRGGGDLDRGCSMITNGSKQFVSLDFVEKLRHTLENLLSRVWWTFSQHLNGANQNPVSCILIGRASVADALSSCDCLSPSNVLHLTQALQFYQLRVSSSKYRPLLQFVERMRSCHDPDVRRREALKFSLATRIQFPILERIVAASYSQ